MCHAIGGSQDGQQGEGEFGVFTVVVVVSVVISVVDSGGLSNSTSFVLNVSAVDDSPWFGAISNFSLYSDFSAYEFNFSSFVFDVDGSLDQFVYNWSLSLPYFVFDIHDNSTAVATLTELDELLNGECSQGVKAMGSGSIIRGFDSRHPLHSMHNIDKFNIPRAFS